MDSLAKQNLYRKYRPQSFSELLGQDHITKTLQAAVSTNRISHAYLFSGPRGTGKTSAARLLAKILNCRQPVTVAKGLVDACRMCDVCKRIEEQTFMDIIEIDAASNNSVDDIRQMREKVKFLPAEGQYKVYIIDEVHMLSGSAFNAFLKTLEEPPPRVVFILATTEQQKVPATIVSRCQCFDFHPIPQKVLVARLAEVVKRERNERSGQFPEVKPEALHLIAECAQGGFRDALGLLDQVASFQNEGLVTVEHVLAITRRLGYAVLRSLADSLLTRDTQSLLRHLNDLFCSGYDVGSIGRDLLEYLRKCLLLKLDKTTAGILEIVPEQVEAMLKQVENVSLEFLVSMVSHLERTLSMLKNSIAPRILFEVELVRIALREISVGQEGLARRIDQIELRLKYSNTLPARTTANDNVCTSYNQQNRPIPLPIRQSVTDFQGNKNEVIEQKSSATEPQRPIELSFEQRFRQTKLRLSESSKILWALVRNAKFEGLKDGVLTIRLENDFAVKKCSEPKSFQNLKEQLEIDFGQFHQLNLIGPNDKMTAGSSTIKSWASTDKVQSGLSGDASEKPISIDSSYNGQVQHNYHEEIAKIEREARQAIIEKPAVSDALSVFGGEILQIEKP